MVKIKDFFLKLRIGWLFIFASFNVWCDHMMDNSKFNFWIDGLYNSDNGPENIELTWHNYEITMKYQKKPRGRRKLKYHNNIGGFLQWQYDSKN